MWTSDRIFSTSSAYRSFFIWQHPTEGAKLLQKARAPPKCKFFIWLVLHDRCWTADRHKRHGLQDDDTCSLCNQLPETIDHLLLVCPFSREVWFRALRMMHWGAVSSTAQTYTLADWWYGARKRISKDDRRCFDFLVVLLCWLLWKERNNGTFNRRVRTINDFLCRRWSCSLVPGRIQTIGASGRRYRQVYRPLNNYSVIIFVLH